LQEATELGKKARELKKAADVLHQEERSGNKGRKWRKNVKAVEKVIQSLSLSHSCTVGSMHAKHTVKQAGFELVSLFSQKYVVFLF
jgi:hypothetical protein